MDVIIEDTADGSHTLFVPQLNEHYHSVNGARQESEHIFIKAGLHHCLKKKINILEIGFGTGLNALLTILDCAKKELKINYTTIERFPLPFLIIKQLNYARGYYQKELFFQLHRCDWNSEIAISDYFSLKKIETDILTFDFNTIHKSDIVYFDAFAPDKQPEIWSEDIFRELYKSMNTEAILVTYCAKGSVRRILQTTGFKVERLKGPPGKREMLRAIK